MRKILSILAAVGLTATASTAAVACSGKKSKDVSKTVTKTVTEDNVTISGKTDSSTLATLFAVKDANGKAYDATYTFTPNKKESVNMQLADATSVKGTIKIDITITKTDSAQTLNLKVDTTDAGKSSVTGFTAKSVTVVVPKQGQKWEAITLKVSDKKTSFNDNGKTLDTYFVLKNVIDQLTEDQAQLLFSSLGFDSSLVGTGKTYASYKDALNSLHNAAQTDPSTDKLEYGAWTGLNITEDNEVMATADIPSTATGVAWYQMGPANADQLKDDAGNDATMVKAIDGKYQIGFYNAATPGTYFLVNITF